MIALDTNVLVRALVEDDPEQAQQARALLRRTGLWACKTVLLELAWVLRSTYRYPPDVVHSALARVVTLEGIEIEDRAAVERALVWFRGGLDFADALHLASSGAATEFATFDAELLSRSPTGPDVPTVLRPGAEPPGPARR